MKRIISLLLLAILAVTMIVSCEADKLQEASDQDITFAAQAIACVQYYGSKVVYEEVSKIATAAKSAGETPDFSGIEYVNETELDYTINNLKISWGDLEFSFVVNGTYEAEGQRDIDTITAGSSGDGAIIMPAHVFKNYYDSAKFTIKVTDVECENEDYLAVFELISSKDGVVIEYDEDSTITIDGKTVTDEEIIEYLGYVLGVIEYQINYSSRLPNSTVYGTYNSHLAHNVSIEDYSDLISSMEDIDCTMTIDNSTSGAKSAIFNPYLMLLNKSVVTLNAVINGKKQSIEYSSIKNTLKINGKKYSCPIESLYPVISNLSSSDSEFSRE